MESGSFWDLISYRLCVQHLLWWVFIDIINANFNVWLCNIFSILPLEAVAQHIISFRNQADTVSNFKSFRGGFELEILNLCVRKFSIQWFFLDSASWLLLIEKLKGDNSLTFSSSCSNEKNRLLKCLKITLSGFSTLLLEAVAKDIISFLNQADSVSK